jgi:hypothetical protein
MNQRDLLLIARRAFALFAVLSVLDLLGCLTVPELRDALGTTGDAGSLALRVAPSVVLILFYGWFLMRGSTSSHAVLSIRLHGILFSILGATTLIPWIGVVVAIFTPISALYLGAINWMPRGFWLAICIAVAFSLWNAYVAVASLRGTD